MKNLKTKLPEYLGWVGLILFWCLGVVMFAHVVGFDGVIKIVLIVSGFFGVIALVLKFNPMLAYYISMGTLVAIVLYAFGMLELAIGVIVMTSALFVIYKIGDHFGWWDKLLKKTHYD